MLLKLILFIVISFLILFFYVLPEYAGEYNASIIDKTNRAENICEPKIILCGNSNVAFGIRSELIEDTFGMPVVNMGLHGALGDEFHENLALYNVKPGDIVVTCPTAIGMAENVTEMDPVVAWLTVENHVRLWKYIPKRHRGKMLRAFSTYIKKSIRLKIEGIGNVADTNSSYSRIAFNKYGDNVFAVTEPQCRYEFPEDYKPNLPWTNQEGMDRYIELSKKIEERGGKLYVAGYPIACENPEELREQLSNVNKDVKEELEEIFISDYNDYVYPYDLFYNTEFHLTEEGANVRTNQLIKDLSTVLK